MIEEQFISFDTAKMLKEVGFDVPCTSQYTENGFAWENLRKTDFNKNGYVFSRPTQTLAARWLCEHKMIEVSTAYCRRRKSWYYQVGYLDCKDEDVIFGYDYASRQYAMEAGLREAIKLIKK